MECLRLFVNIEAVRHDSALLRLQQPQNDIHHGRLARARCTDESHRLSLFYREISISDHSLLHIWIVIGHMFRTDLPLQIPRFLYLIVLPLHISLDFRQVMIYQIHRRQRVQDTGRILIDLTHAGHQAQRRHGKDRQLRHIIDNIRLTEKHFNDDRCQKPRHTYRFHNILGQDGDHSADPQSSGKFRIIFLIFIDKILLSV